MPPADWWHPMWWFPMFPFLFIVLCIIVVLFVMIPMMTRHGPWSHGRDRSDFPQRTALDVLNERFAKGEIDRAEYEEKRVDISRRIKMTAVKPAISATLPALAIAALVATSPVVGQSAPQQQAPGVMQPGSSGQAPPQMPGGMMGGSMRSPMMGMMGQGGMMTMMMGMGDHVEGRIAFLKTELKITDTQTVQWNAFADVLRANAKRTSEMRNTVMQGGMMGQGGTSLSAPDRLDRMEMMMTTMLDTVKATRSALGPLYAVLSDDQKKMADQLIHGPMGMGRM
jgi:hypothetical protein